MEAKDLMVGDWLKNTLFDEFEQVDYLEDNNINGHPTDWYEPIPLTPEILERNGFVYNAIPFMDGWEQFGLTLYRGGNGYRIDCGINRSLIIDFVHELQHALKLCGIDKEIEL